MKKIKEILTFTIKLTPLIFYLASPLYIATEYATAANSPGCYKIVDGEANKLTCPTSNVVYDNEMAVTLLIIALILLNATFTQRIYTTATQAGGNRMLRWTVIVFRVAQTVRS